MTVYCAFPPSGLDREQANEQIQTLIDFITRRGGQTNKLHARLGVRISLDDKLSVKDVFALKVFHHINLDNWDVSPKWSN